eukprot:TRINITY_DN44056_c0_g1_i3.p1 TRINITY_DN44056_c0_g1~~TRINITY_DN44056_c0_g1_i3.p1  ORF type:complete len:141 (+),score=8.90 TRINITY_DN44056_c0_g1_i3:88-510(+)
MMKISVFLLRLLIWFLNFSIIWPLMALPLNTNSRWIIDGGGQRVNLAYVNLASHLEITVAVGLDKRPLDAISKQIASMKFKFVRLTWALFMVTNSTLGSITFRQSLQNHGVVDTINPGVVDLPVIQVFQVLILQMYMTPS